MPRDPQKYQKALMKKRSKQKAATKAHAVQRASAVSSARSIIGNARTYPFLECLISSKWKKDDMGLVEVLVARQQPDGNVCFGLYLIDKYCLGLKNTLSQANVPLNVYRKELVDKLFHGTKPEKCSPELAHQMIYAAIEYAQQFGFQPESDFVLTQHILAPRGELAETYQLTFGKNGKPFFIAGPHDNVDRVLKQLEKTAGPGNFDYLAMMGDTDMF
ncbi:MAG TPA: hypothetical protein VGM01_15335 [Ktedonobacteraceae bacterium]|jgi:hypothetical protein